MTPAAELEIPRKAPTMAASARNHGYEMMVSVLIGVTFFLLLRGTPDLPGGFDGYRHVKQAFRLLTEPHAMFADPWRLANFWHAPVDAWFGYHLLLTPLVAVFDLITAAKIASASIFGLIAYVMFQLLGHVKARCRTAWVLLALTGSCITLCRATTVRPFLLSVLLTLLAALLTLEDKPVKLGLVSLIHALSYSMFFLVAIGPAFWLLLRRDRRSLVTALSSFAGVALGLLANPYFPQNLLYDVVQARVVDVGLKGHVQMGGELFPTDSWWWIAATLPVMLLWTGALLGLWRWRRSELSPATGLFLAISAVTFLGTWRVVRTADFFVPFAILFAATVISPHLTASRNAIAAVGALLFLPCAVNVYLTHQYVAASPSLARFRGAAEYLRTNAPGELVANAQWADYQFLFFLNSENRYLIGIEPTFMFMADPRKYWFWRHMSADEPSTCGRENCADSERIDIVQAVRDRLGARYVFAEHAINPRLESALHQKTGVAEVYRDSAFSIFRLPDSTN